MKPLHFGCTPWLTPIGGRADVLVRQAQLAERLGYASFWLPESHFNGVGAIPDPLMLLAAVAAATERIRLATTSYLLPLRHPLQAAEQVAVLDQLSNGRVILGVGRGFAPELFDAFGRSRSAKRELFAECLAVMRDAWAGGPIGASELHLAPLPVQQPHPPVWVAAFGPKALAQAGALGLPYLASPVESLAMLEANYALHRDACRGAGLPLPAEVPVMRTVFVSRRADQLAAVRVVLQRQLEQLRRQNSMLRSVPEQVEDWAIIGSPEGVREEIARYRERLGMSHLIATRLQVGAIEASLVALDC